MREKAFLISKNEGVYHRSFTKGDGRMVGFLGEQVFQYLRPGAMQANSRTYDFIVGGKKIEVKTRIMPREPVWETDDIAIKFNQDPKDYECDYFAMLGMAKDFSKCWLLGWISKNDFLAKHFIIRKGTKLTARYVAEQDNHAIKLKDLSRLT